MKFLTSIWSAVIGALVISMLLFMFLMNRAMKTIKAEHDHMLAKNLTAAPEKPFDIPDGIDENIKAFIAELEERDAKIRAREESINGMINSIKQEKEELAVLQNKVLGLQDDFAKNVEAFQDEKIILQKAEQDQMKDLAATIEGLSPAAAVSLFLQMNSNSQENYPDRTVLGILDLMDPRDIAPIFEEMTGGKEATDESKALAAALTLELRNLVVNDDADDDNAGG